MQTLPNRQECELAEQFLDAIAAGDVKLYYQPIYELTGNSVRLAGFEALTRWGERSPEKFIRNAKKCGVLLPFCTWVVRGVIGQSREWDVAKHGLWLSVNLSPIHLANQNFLDDVKTVAKNLGVGLGTLHLEITEGEALSLVSASVLEHFSKDFKFGIDDFGAGHSNTDALATTPISFMKIDRSLVPHGIGDRRRTDVLIALTTLARVLGIETILEGLETEEQRIIAAICGVNYGQGFLWSKALPPHEARKLF